MQREIPGEQVRMRIEQIKESQRKKGRLLVRLEDGNVLRVVSRLAAYRENIDLPQVKRDIREQVAAVIPPKRPGDFNQALMELGAVVCLPNGAPRCEECPLAELCQAREQGIAEELPLRSEKKGAPQ